MKTSFVTLVFALYCIVLTQAGYFTVTDEVVFDITVDGEPKGSIVLGLFGEEVPKTVENFLALATTGIDGKKYQGTAFHRVIARFMMQGGDVVSGDGRGAISKFGRTFPDENFNIQHGMGGMLSMANSGKDTNGCQFFITTTHAPWLDGKHVVFGKVVEGWNLLMSLGESPTDDNDRPFKPIVIAKSGVRPLASTYQVTDDAHDWWSWIKAVSIPLTLCCSVIGFLQHLNSKIKVDHLD